MLEVEQAVVEIDLLTLYPSCTSMLSTIVRAATSSLDATAAQNATHPDVTCCVILEIEQVVGCHLAALGCRRGGRRPALATAAAAAPLGTTIYILLLLLVVLPQLGSSSLLLLLVMLLLLLALRSAGRATATAAATLLPGLALLLLLLVLLLPAGKAAGGSNFPNINKTNIHAGGGQRLK
jgi:hypothetical protein